MPRNMLLSIMIYACFLLLTETSFSQGPLDTEKIKGVKGLKTVAVVIEPTDKPNIERIIGIKDLGDMVEVGLHNRVPELRPGTPAEETDNWLSLEIYTTEDCAVLGISLYRRVKVLDSGEETISKVWWDQRFASGGKVDKKYLQEMLDTLLTRFAADYLRANQ